MLNLPCLSSNTVWNLACWKKGEDKEAIRITLGIKIKQLRPSTPKGPEGGGRGMVHSLFFISESPCT
jgi:hypothetical protein